MAAPLRTFIAIGETKGCFSMHSELSLNEADVFAITDAFMHIDDQLPNQIYDIAL